MLTPTTLAGRYRLDRTLAAGGMGQVWLAHDTVLGRDVAVKVQQVSQGEDAAALERFRREAKALAALHHRNVVTVYDGGVDGSWAFIVMELLSGPTLAEYVAEHGPLPEDEVARLAAEVASGLAAAHGAGVVHRDIKPGNLVFDAHGILKIVDFGIARLSHAAGPRLTEADIVVGSVPYLSPEQVAGHPADERSDLYALGCVMTLMLTGRPPFEAEHPVAIARQHLHSDPPLVRDRRPGVGPGLETLVRELLSKSPESRPASAGDVRARLASLGSDVTTAMPAGELAAASGLAAVGLGADRLGADRFAETREMRVQPLGRETRRSRRPPSRPWWIPALVLTLGAVLLGLVLVPLLGGGDAPASDGTVAGAALGTPRASETSATSVPTTTATTTTARPTTTKATTRTPTPSPTTRSPLALLRATVDAAIASGEVNARKAPELKQRVDGVVSAVRQGHTRDARRQIRDTLRYVDELARRHQITSSAASRIRTALRQVSASL